MQFKKTLGTLLLCLFIISLIGCDRNEKDLGYRGFMCKATIVDNSTKGYYCYLDGGGLVVSYDQRLAGVERGYFAFNYMEADWKSTGKVMYIDNANVLPYSIYDVIRPISIEEADSTLITSKDNLLLQSRLALGHGYRGYFDLNTGISVVNLESGEKVFAKINLVYDPAKQNSDTLLLNLSYDLKIPDKWSKTSLTYSAVSCDFSSLAIYQQWSDSLTIVVDAGDKNMHAIKISKDDFLKSDISIEI